MQSANCKMQNDLPSEPPRLDVRLLDFAVAVVKLANMLPRTVTGRHIGRQLIRSGTSAAANYEEACAGESRADFLHKLQISLKELRESRFWLRLVLSSQLAAEAECKTVLRGSEELCKIIAKSILTAKRNNTQ